MISLYFLLFIFGLMVGSFLNAVIYRLQVKKSFLKGRSFCPYCKHKLSWQDLIPVFSFFILKGKCRYCGKKISWQYPLVEIATASLFLLIIFNFQFSWTPAGGLPGGLLFNFYNFITSLYLFITTSFLIIIFVYDLKHFIIPDKVIYPAIAIAFLYNLILNSRFSILNSLAAALGAAGFFFAIILISRGRWMGFGDVKLAFFMGLLLGSPKILVALFFAFLIGAIIGIGLILAKRKTLKSEVPFAPFLVIGTFIALFWGQRIIDWYISLILF